MARNRGAMTSKGAAACTSGFRPTACGNSGNPCASIFAAGALVALGELLARDPRPALGLMTVRSDSNTANGFGGSFSFIKLPSKTEPRSDLSRPNGPERQFQTWEISSNVDGQTA